MAAGSVPPTPYGAGTLLALPRPPPARPLALDTHTELPSWWAPQT